MPGFNLLSPSDDKAVVYNHIVTSEFPGKVLFLTKCVHWSTEGAFFKRALEVPNVIAFFKMIKQTTNTQA